MNIKLRKLHTYEEMEEWKKKLENFLPESQTVITGLQMNIKFHLKDHPHFKVDVFVPEADNPPCFVASTPACSAETVTSVMVFWDKATVFGETLEGFIMQMYKWDSSKPLFFYNTHTSLSNEARKYLKAGDESSSLNEGRVVMYESGTLYQGTPCAVDLTSLPDDLEIRPIHKASIDCIASYWKYSWSERIEFIKYMIETFPSAAIYRKTATPEDDKYNKTDPTNPNNPLSWILLYPVGNIGLTYTVEEYRRKGLSRIINHHMMNVVSEIGITPHSAAGLSNIISNNFHHAIGYKKKTLSSWWFYLPPGIKMEDITESSK